MCYGCWEEAGSPKTINDRVSLAASLVSGVYDYSCVGGNLHVHLDDWNLEDEFFDEFKEYDDDASEDQLTAERKCFEAFKSLSEPERYSALALARGYFSAENK